MPSPFPGMDPYLESYLWSDVHTALANKIRQQLTPQIRPRYAARLEVYLAEDPTPEAEVGILYPDVEILRGQHQETLPAKNVLITCIEILSPVSKREPGLSVYRQKHQRLYQAGVHLIELDFLRRGTRSFNHHRIPNVAYLVTLIRANSGVIDVWTIELQDQLPIIPIPLRDPDADSLDLAFALNAIYDEAAYDLSIDYGKSPPPPQLNMSDAKWVEDLLATFRQH